MATQRVLEVTTSPCGERELPDFATLTEVEEAGDVRWEVRYRSYPLQVVGIHHNFKRALTDYLQRVGSMA